MSILGRLFGRREATTDAKALPAARGDTSSFAGAWPGGWTQGDLGVGTGLHRVASATFRRAKALVREEIDAMLTQNAVARRIAYRLPSDALSKWFQISVGGSVDAALSAAFVEAFDRAGIMRELIKAAAFERAYGGSLLLLSIEDGGESGEPVRDDRARRIVCARAVDRFACRPADWATHRRRRSPGSVEVWEVEDVWSGRWDAWHSSRVIVFAGMDHSDRVLRDDPFSFGVFGPGLFDLIIAQLREYGVNTTMAAELSTVLTQGVFKRGGLTNAVMSDPGMVASRLRSLRRAMSMFGDIAVDKDEEDYSVVQRGATGFRELAEVTERAMTAATGMPRVVLFGEVPGGLNSGGASGEWSAWFTQAADARESIYSAPVLSIVKRMASCSDGPTGGVALGSFSLEWPPLWEMDPKELASVRLQNAQARQIDVMSGAVSTDEARTDPDIENRYQLEEGSMAPYALPIVAMMSNGEVGGDEIETFDDPASIPQDEPTITLRQAATAMGLSPATIKRAIASGKLRAWKPGRDIRILESEVRAWMTGSVVGGDAS